MEIYVRNTTESKELRNVDGQSWYNIIIRQYRSVIFGEVNLCKVSLEEKY